MYFPTADIDVSPFVPPLMAFAVSFFSSMGGLSGAFLLLPLLMTFLGYTNPSVSATNQLYNVFSSPGGIFRYCREGRLLWPLSWIIIAGAVPGVVAGGFIRLHWLAQVRPFKLFVALVLFGIALEMLYDLLGRRRAAPAPASGRLHAFSVPAVCACSVAVGLVGGIYGIGGGAIIAPFLVSMFRLPIHTVAGATLMATFVNALAGVLFYVAVSPFYPGLSVAPDWGLAALLSLGGLTGMYCGARFQKRVPPVLLKWMLVLTLLGMVAVYGAELLGD